MNRGPATRATITGLLDGLERDGLVRREPDPADRRGVGIRMTPRGERLLHRFLPGHFRRVRRLFSGFTNEEPAELRRLLGKVRDATPAARETE